MLILGTCWTTFVFMSMLKSDICQISNVNVDSWDMQNNFCLHVYAQNSLFIGEIAMLFFSWEPALWTVHSQERVLMWSQKKHKWKVLSKKSIDIFNFKQRLLSIDIKTKVVQHVPRIIFNVFKVFKFSSFVFMSRFKSCCLKLKMSMLFFYINAFFWQNFMDSSSTLSCFFSFLELVLS